MVPFLTLSFWQQLEQWDQWLFLKINSDWTNSFFDTVLPFLRDSVFWAPLYLFIFVFLVFNYGKKGVWWAIAFLCTVALADIVSSRFFKEFFERLRPCQDPLLQEQVRLLLKRCAGGYSFTSSHAANHFGIATFISCTFFTTFGRWIYLSYLWAFFISYAQIYVGVHYPLDVAGGAAIGTLAGLLTAWIFNNKWGSFTLAK
ncbi:MAG: phosphatase PAP2 family protein [Chitinophagaceae bacterium]